MSALPFSKTLYDEKKPVGLFGHGTHYSVIRVPIWQDKWLNPLPTGSMLDFAIIWDVDHDERVFPVIEEIYFEGLLAPVRFIGESKGTLSVLIDAETVQAWKPAAFKRYREEISDISLGNTDPWDARVSSLEVRDASIILEGPERVSAYLQHIDMLWNIGIKPHATQAEYPEEDPPLSDDEGTGVPF